VDVVFTSTVELLSSAVYMGRVPLAEHDSLYPGNTRRTGAGNITWGGTIVLEQCKLINICFIFFPFALCSTQFFPHEE